MKPLFSSLTRLRVRLAVIIAAALAPAGVLAIVQAVNAVEDLSDRQADLLEVLALNAVDVERAGLMEIRQTMRAVALDAGKALADEPDCRAKVQQLRTEHDWLLSIAILDRDGQSRCRTDDPFSIGDKAVWDEFLANPSFTLSGIRAGRTADESILEGYHPIDRSDGGAIALGVSINIASFRAVSSVANEDVDVALLDRSGEIIAANNEDGVQWLPTDRSMLRVFGDRRVDASDANGTVQTYIISSLVADQLWSVINVHETSVVANLFNAAGLTIIAPIAIWLIAVIVAYFAIELLVTRHIGELRRVAVRIGNGDLQAAAAGLDDAPTEIKALGASITAMRDKIADREAELTQTLDVQRRLLLEIHHRVKNNLQTISSLLNLESARITSPETQAQIASIQGRIHSLAMVHQNLYAAENLEEVALDQLTRDIASHLQDSLAPEGEASTTEMKLEPLVAPTIMATPTALFLSEALGNAFKHAASPPDVRVSLARRGAWIDLTISNILATSSERDQEDASGLGLQLMRGFAKQVGGTFDMGRRDGRFYVSLSLPADQNPSLFSVRKS